MSTASRTQEISKNRRPEQVGWYFYDWASSPFSSSVVTVFLGPYLTSIAMKAAGADGLLNVLGIPLQPPRPFHISFHFRPCHNSSRSRFLALSQICTGMKKQMLLLFAYGGAFSTVAMYGITENAVLRGGLLFLSANFCFGAGWCFTTSCSPNLHALMIAIRFRARDGLLATSLAESCWPYISCF